MNIITLNETRSTLIKGLLIQSLPPITKPQQRVLTETIDGRDGDRLTLLGYAAYDKTVQIGLCGDYDVDQVIQYFVDNMSGEVIFSNEPDKYYRYTIVKQIDFERLLRFKQAKVTFHVQPFKYSATPDTRTIYGGLATIYNNGNTSARPILTIYASASFDIYINDVKCFEIDASGITNHITLDGETLNAYEGSTLKNRYVTGDLNRLRFNVGRNDIECRYEGTSVISQMIIEHISRWI